MKTGKISYVAPVLGRDGVQRSFTGQHGTTYYFTVEMEDGTKGEVGGKTEGTYRFKEGDVVEYEYTENKDPRFPGKLKIERPGSGAGYRGGGGKSPMGSPARFLLAAIIESGIKSDQWEPALTKAIEVLAKVDKPADPPLPNGKPTVALGPPAALDIDDLSF